MTAKTILSIDQSTSATKALLFDASGKLIEKVARDHRQSYPAPGRVEHDAQEIWENLVRAVDELLGRNRSRVGEPSFMSLANQRETVVVFDRATGRPLRPAMVWQCRRGDAICRELLEAGYGPLVTQRTGLRLDGYFSGSKLAWMMRNDPQAAGLIRDGKALVGTIDAYLIYRLTGGKVFATDPTNASRTLLFDIYQRQWSRQLCELFDVPINALPQVRDSSASFGATNVQGLLSREIEIRGVMGDSQAAMLAQGCVRPGQGKVTLGTGASVLVNVGKAAPRLDENAGVVTGIAWTHNGTTIYCLEGIINYAAATVAWLKDQLQLIASPQETESIAGSVADSAGVYLVPAFGGLSAPYWSSNARAAIVGLTAGTGKAHVVRAALDSIAHQIADVLEMIRQQANIPLEVLHVDGGASKNVLLMQMIADLTRCTLHASAISDGAPLGAALAGRWGVSGSGSWEQTMDSDAGASVYRPQMPEPSARAYRDGWRRAVRQVLTGAG